MSQNSYDPNLPALISITPYRWFWRLAATGELRPCEIHKVTPHTDKVNLTWYEANGTEHYVADARHISVVGVNADAWVGSDPNSGDSGYVPTS